jgi:hypothetical protein
MGPSQDGENDRDSMFLPGMEDLAAPEQPASTETGTDKETSNTPSRMSADANPLNLSNAGVPPQPTPPNGQPGVHAGPPSSTLVEDRPGAGNSPHPQAAPPQPPDFVEPLWMRRSKLVIFVMACIYLGIILIILPWNEVWTQNGLIHRYPALRDLAMNNFLRGAITGLGFVNVWLGVWEAVHYREPKK